jgi:hypothetical protein
MKRIPYLIPNLTPSPQSVQLRDLSTDWQIRKRKLEKADILELSVKYMKSLQNSLQGREGGPGGAGVECCEATAMDMTKLGKGGMGPDLVVLACNPSTREIETGGSGFEASLGYTARLCLNFFFLNEGWLERTPNWLRRGH